MRILIVRVSLAVMLIADVAHSGAFAQNAARLQTAMTSTDVKVFNKCLAMTEQEMNACVACVDILQKAKLTTSDLALIKDCKSQSTDMMVQDKGCLIMNNNYPEIMLLAK